MCVSLMADRSQRACVFGDKDTLVRGQGYRGRDPAVLRSISLPADLKPLPFLRPVGRKVPLTGMSLPWAGDYAENRFYEVRFNENGEICYLLTREQQEGDL